MKNLRLKLLVSLILFTVILVSVVAFTNRELLRADVKIQQQKSRELIENHIISDMRTVDNAHFYFDSVATKQLEIELKEMVKRYEKDPNILEWDLEALKAKHGYEIYVLDAENTVVHTTFKSDLGWSFSECCKGFSSQLDERRLTGTYYSDAINISSTTGSLWKYSYLGTPDKKYLLELGVDAATVPLFQKFNFFNTTKNLIEKYDDLVDVRILNAGGSYLDANPGEDYSIKGHSKEFQEAYYQALKTMSPVQFEKKLQGGYIETYRFIPYEAEQSRDASTKRIIYMKYGNESELALLKRNIQQFWVILAVAIVTSILLLIIIIRILTKTIRLATYDPLTGANNRASYLSLIEDLLRRKRKGKIGLLVIDLDNFKNVNDQFGHTVGDIVLVELVKILKDCIKKDGFVARFGGDEFAVVLYDASFEKLEEIAQCILYNVRTKKEDRSNNKWNPLSISIGGALQEKEDETEDSLFMRADQALYQSKNMGKDCYSPSKLNLESPVHKE
ncbi:GGDEF domain-containing protein [Lysinibacillus sp. 54212]|uniref:GGDEF domain-containing protein n=1 Tax=Lysinibacillus sp. 54212 TaxID=3119829 RepID=UPI002FC778A8